MCHAVGGVAASKPITHILVECLDLQAAGQHVVSAAALTDVVLGALDLDHDLAARGVVDKALRPLDAVHLVASVRAARAERVPVRPTVAYEMRVKRGHFGHDLRSRTLHCP